jgi:hypothetical protein
MPSGEWHALKDRFGAPAERRELGESADATGLLLAWGAPDLVLYDSYVAGHVSTRLSGRRSGADVLPATGRGTRLERYLELCAAEARDDETRARIETCRSYLQSLDELLEVARGVP